MEILVVRLAESPDVEFMDRITLDRFIELKSGTLGYVHASIKPRLGCALDQIVRAPIGAIERQVDAKRFLRVLATELPQIKFFTETRNYPDAEDVCFHKLKPQPV